MPTVEEFLGYKPKRIEYPWSTSEDGIVTITVPKFTSNIGKSFCRVLKKENTFEAHLDKLGSAIWKECDGIHSVKEILDMVTKEFPYEKNIDQRLYLFIQQLKVLNYLTY